jgi:hypothetical protein
MREVEAVGCCAREVTAFVSYVQFAGLKKEEEEANDQLRNMLGSWPSSSGILRRTQ